MKRENDPHKIKLFPNYLWLLILTYSMFLAMSNWFNARPIKILGQVFTPGALIFPITFIVADIITYVYGYKFTRLSIWIALLFNILFIVFGQIAISLPSPSYIAQDADEFAKLLQLDTWIVIGSFLSYVISEPVNAYITAKMKIRFKHLIGTTFVTSTFIASGIDSFLFANIAFWKTLQTAHIQQIAFTIWVLKVLIEIIILPISIRLAKLLKHIEKLDIYDTKTNFNPFSLDISYEASDNKYKE